MPKYLFTGNCPYTNQPQTISITYYKPLGSFTGNSFKKGEYSCSLNNECSYPKDSFGRCPVYLEAPRQPQG